MIANIGFSDASFTISRTIKPVLCLLLALLFLSWVLGSHPWLFFFHQSLGFGSHVTRLCFPSWSAGCVLRRRLLMSGSSFTPILSFGSRVSLALVCFFSPACEFLVVIVHLVLLSRCSVRNFFSGLFLQLHLVVVYSDVACGWSLQHCCVVLCFDVVAGPAPMR